VYTPNALNQYVAVNIVDFTYDANGNLTYDGKNHYEYDCENELLKVITPTQTIVYDYD
jgi:hypothetical protein